MNFDLNGFYPIGTVCKIEGYSELVMIIGYFKKNSDIASYYDYEGCFYPYGSLTKVKILFNQNQIIELVFEGYKKMENNNDDKEINDTFYSVESEEEKVYVDEDIYFVKNKVYNQLLFDKHGKILIAEEKNSKQ